VEAQEITQEDKCCDSVQYDEKGHTAACVSIALPFQKERINADDVDFFSVVGRGFYCHRGPRENQ
jgi:hypothetical protein